MIDSEMFIEAQIDQAVITTPAVGVDDGSRIGFTPDNGLQRGFRGIRDNLRYRPNHRA